jgi:hypothetical protein
MPMQGLNASEPPKYAGYGRYCLHALLSLETSILHVCGAGTIASAGGKAYNRYPTLLIPSMTPTLMLT